jgi:primosomal protein N' (replication factor Y)
MFGSIPNISELEIYGPAPAPLSKLKGRHRQRFLIHDKKARNMQKIVNAWLKNSKSLSSVNISVDIDPFSFV